MVLHVLAGRCQRRRELMTAPSARHFDAVSFDFYGTLIHHRNGRGRGSNLVDYVREQGMEPGPWEHRMLYDMFDRHDTDYSPDLPEDEKRDYLRHLAARAFGCLGVEGGDELAETHAASLWQILGPDAFALFPETKSVLAALRAGGYPLVLVSNWQRGLGHFVTELDLADAFDQVVGSAELGVAKPDSRIFEVACDRLGARPERVLHVGDTLRDDYEGGREAGLHTVLLHRGPETTPSGVQAIDNLRQLLPGLLSS